MSDSPAALPPEPKAISKNANDPKQAKRAKVTERQRELDRLADVRQLMTHPWGRRLAWRLMNEVNIFGSGWASDAHRMAFLNGQREFGLKFLGDIQATSPDEYALMLKEAKERD